MNSPCHPGTPLPQATRQEDPQRMMAHQEGELPKLGGGKSPTQGFSCREASASSSQHSLGCRRTLMTASFCWHRSKEQFEGDVRKGTASQSKSAAAAGDSSSPFCCRCTQGSGKAELLHAGCPPVRKREPAAPEPQEAGDDDADLCSQHSPKDLQKSHPRSGSS